MLTGGGAMFLNDALSWCEGLKPIFCHHEQTCAMAAEAYARFTGKLGVINVTTGPGGINALNGVYGAWTDSIPMIILSGQVKRKTTLRATGQLNKLRQLGDQEVDIVSLAKPITKKALFITEVSEVPFALEEAISLSRDGRPGPVWLDIPIDIQSAELEVSKFFHCATSKYVTEEENLKDAALKVISLIRVSRRPLFLIGSGVRASGSLEQLKSISKKLSIPSSTTWTAVDSMDFNDDFFAERPGVVGTRAGNFIAQKADLIIILGTRLPIRQVSYNFENFGKKAIKVGVDIDFQELTKPMVELDFMIHANLSPFIKSLEKHITEFDKPIKSELWLSDIHKIKKEFPPLEANIRAKGHTHYLNPYIFVDDLWNKLNSNDIVACADASASVIPLQIAKIKYGQRLFTNAGSASMGYDIPAAIGASLANPTSRIICIAGDGSIMLNIQDLETIKRYQLNIKMLILNNEGYLSIKQSQQGFFKRQKGSGIENGINFPNFEKIALANDVRYIKVEKLDDYPRLDEILQTKGPSLIEVMIDPNQSFEPKLSSFVNQNGEIESNSLENMTPMISKEKIELILRDNNDN